jgi:GT2 family glycosyltransferase
MSKKTATGTQVSERVFGGTQRTVGVQSVLFNSEPKGIERAVAALARSAELASNICPKVTIHYGDSSLSPCLGVQELESLRQRHPSVHINYTFFNGNLGSARGHNELSKSNGADIFLIQNPDVIVAPRLIEIMATEFNAPGVGMVEAKQLPIEHPKDYDPRTGETAWATTACTMIPAALFRELNGFDADNFFLYCDDVDFSWRVRLCGLKVIFQPGAVAFHDKRLSREGKWLPSAAERYYSAEAALFLSYKWSRSDITEQLIVYSSSDGNDDLARAARVFAKRKEEGRLPIPLDDTHSVGQFVDGEYARHRYPL